MSAITSLFFHIFNTALIEIRNVPFWTRYIPSKMADSNMGMCFRMDQTYLGNKLTWNIYDNCYQPVIGCKLFKCIPFFAYFRLWLSKMSFSINDTNVSMVLYLVFCYLSMVAGLCHFVFSPRNKATRNNEKTPREKTKHAKRQNNAMGKDEITKPATRKVEIPTQKDEKTLRKKNAI